jgi:hypothetical protein
MELDFPVRELFTSLQLSLVRKK